MPVVAEGARLRSSFIAAPPARCLHHRQRSSPAAIRASNWANQALAPPAFATTSRASLASSALHDDHHAITLDTHRDTTASHRLTAGSTPPRSPMEPVAEALVDVRPRHCRVPLVVPADVVLGAHDGQATDRAPSRRRPGPVRDQGFASDDRGGGEQVLWRSAVVVAAHDGLSSCQRRARTTGRGLRSQGGACRQIVRAELARGAHAGRGSRPRWSGVGLIVRQALADGGSPDRQGRPDCTRVSAS